MNNSSSHNLTVCHKKSVQNYSIKITQNEIKNYQFKKLKNEAKKYKHTFRNKETKIWYKYISALITTANKKYKNMNS